MASTTRKVKPGYKRLRGKLAKTDDVLDGCATTVKANRPCCHPRLEVVGPRRDNFCPSQRGTEGDYQNEWLSEARNPTKPSRNKNTVGPDSNKWLYVLRRWRSSSSAGKNMQMSNGGTGQRRIGHYRTRIACNMQNMRADR